MSDEPDYFRVTFEDGGRRLVVNALVASVESTSRLIELLRVCRDYMERAADITNPPETKP